MADLFAGLEPERIHVERPDGAWDYWPALFAPDEARALFAELRERLAWRQHAIRLQGRTIPVPRLDVWYGDPGKRYAYSGIVLEPEPWEPRLLAIKVRIEAATGHAFNSVLANLYRDGRDSVAWHSDDEPELGRDPVIASLSFGAERDFCLRHKRLRALPTEVLRLASGSLLLMTGATQHHWRHCVPKRAGLLEPRINLTFRRIV